VGGTAKDPVDSTSFFLDIPKIDPSDDAKREPPELPSSSGSRGASPPVCEEAPLLAIPPLKGLFLQYSFSPIFPAFNELGCQVVVQWG
jgi:hypothetical protein